MLQLVIYTTLGLALILSLCLMIMVVLAYRTTYRPTNTSAPAFCDLLDYATLVDDEVIALKSGGLMAIYEIKVPSQESMSATQLNHFYEFAQKALLKLNGNYCVHVDVVRTRDPNYRPSLSQSARKLAALADLESAQEQLLTTERPGYHSKIYLTIRGRRPSSPAR